MSTSGTLPPRAVLVHRRTELTGLLDRHGTRGQAAFFLRSRGRRIEDVEDRHHRRRRRDRRRHRGRSRTAGGEPPSSGPSWPGSSSSRATSSWSSARTGWSPTRPSTSTDSRSSASTPSRTAIRACWSGIRRPRRPALLAAAGAGEPAADRLCMVRARRRRRAGTPRAQRDLRWPRQPPDGALCADAACRGRPRRRRRRASSSALAPAPPAGAGPPGWSGIAGSPCPALPTSGSPGSSAKPGHRRRPALAAPRVSCWLVSRCRSAWRQTSWSCSATASSPM